MRSSQEMKDKLAEKHSSPNEEMFTEDQHALPMEEKHFKAIKPDERKHIEEQRSIHDVEELYKSNSAYEGKCRAGEVQQFEYEDKSSLPMEEKHFKAIKPDERKHIDEQKSIRDMEKLYKSSSAYEGKCRAGEAKQFEYEEKPASIKNESKQPDEDAPRCSKSIRDEQHRGKCSCKYKGFYRDGEVKLVGDAAAKAAEDGEMHVALNEMDRERNDDALIKSEGKPVIDEKKNTESIEYERKHNDDKAEPVEDEETISESNKNEGKYKDEDEATPITSTKCAHAKKHVSASKCSSAWKKTGPLNQSLRDGGIVCLQCGKVWDEMQAAQTHASRSNHPVAMKVKNEALICLKCDGLVISSLDIVKTEPLLAELQAVKAAWRLKTGGGLLEKRVVVILSAAQELVESVHVIPKSVGELSFPPKGLKNLGNTCFFNSVLQVLNCTPFKSALKDCIKLGNSNGTLSSSLSKFFNEVSAEGLSSSKLVSPSSLFGSVCKSVAPHFEGLDQQDSQEFLTLLLSGVDDEFSSKRKPEVKFQTHVIKAREDGPMEPSEDWKTKHAHFWFADDQKVLERYPYDEDGDDDSHLFMSPVEDELEDKDEVAVVDPQTMNPPVVVNTMETSRNPVKSTFATIVESAVTCDDCGTETVMKETHYMLSLPLVTPEPPPLVGKGKNRPDDASKNQTVQTCLDAFSRAEKLSVENGTGFQCSKCAQRRNQKVEDAPRHDAVQCLRVSGSANGLILHFKRFQHVAKSHGTKSIRMIKIDSHVALEPRLHFPGVGTFDLVGVVEHLGKSIHSGHYVAFVRRGCEWYRCSDDSVSKCPAAHALSAQCYLAFYDRA